MIIYLYRTIDRPNDNEGPFSTTGTASSVAATPSDAEVNVADVKDLDLDPELGILDEEAEAWVGTVDKKTSKKLKDKEVKRQEHIYEFIITEKHHCLTLKVMQKVSPSPLIIISFRLTGFKFFSTRPDLCSSK